MSVSPRAPSASSSSPSVSESSKSEFISSVSATGLGGGCGKDGCDARGGAKLLGGGEGDSESE